MPFKILMVAWVATILGTTAAAAAGDAKNPDPQAVVLAYMAVRNVGNVDAALAFYTDDGFFLLTGGNKFTGQEELRGLHEMFVRENVQNVTSPAAVSGNVVVLRNLVSTSWLTKFELSPIPSVSVVTVEGNKIKSWIGYYPVSSLLKMEQACRDKPEVLVPRRPCKEIMPRLRAHTEGLIAQGIAEKE